jgi:hypothetical protein
MTGSKRFLVTWSVVLVVILAAAAGMNIVVDPYDRFGWQRIPALNLLKPATRSHVALTKAYQAERARPVTVLLGTSRAYLGIDAASSFWPSTFRPVFNYGIPATNMTQSLLRDLRQAWAIGRLRHAVVILDFPAFFVPDPPLIGGDDERRLRFLDNGAPNDQRDVQRFNDAFFSSFTFGALLDSVRTIMAQSGGERVLDLRADGTSTEADFATAARVEGMNSVFAQKNAGRMAEIPIFTRALAGWRGPLPNFDIVSEMISFCRERDVTLTLILASFHADEMETYRRVGLWPRVEQLKKDLASAVARANRDTITAWDFVEYSPYTTEIVPPPGDKVSPTRWFWEQAHFKRALGEVMLRRVFEGAPSDFGAPLTPDTIADRNELVREQQKGFVGWRLACEQTDGDDCGHSIGMAATAER